MPRHYTTAYRDAAGKIVTGFANEMTSLDHVQRHTEYWQSIEHTDTKLFTVFRDIPDWQELTDEKETTHAAHVD